ncbi:hypothetical protein ACP70R_022243 [Stipagrostis hirtigluma subsp. patula]
MGLPHEVTWSSPEPVAEKSIPRWKSFWMLKMLYQSTEPGYLLAVLGIDRSEIQRNVLFSQQATVMVFTSLRGSPQPEKNLSSLQHHFAMLQVLSSSTATLQQVIPCSTMRC